MVGGQNEWTAGRHIFHPFGAEPEIGFDSDHAEKPEETVERRCFLCRPGGAGAARFEAGTFAGMRLSGTHD
jgi:hypothetical protein